jgi:hypothetical protein
VANNIKIILDVNIWVSALPPIDLFQIEREQIHLGIIVAYAVSKLMEFFDAGIYSALGVISGHSLKHLMTAFAAFIFYWALQKRQILSKQ